MTFRYWRNGWSDKLTLTPFLTYVYKTYKNLVKFCRLGRLLKAWTDDANKTSLSRLFQASMQRLAKLNARQLTRLYCFCILKQQNHIGRLHWQRHWQTSSQSSVKWRIDNYVQEIYRCSIFFHTTTSIQQRADTGRHFQPRPGPARWHLGPYPARLVWNIWISGPSPPRAWSGLRTARPVQASNLQQLGLIIICKCSNIWVEPVIGNNRHVCD